MYTVICFQLMADSFEETKEELKNLVSQLEAVDEERKRLIEENQQIKVKNLESCTYM